MILKNAVEKLTPAIIWINPTPVISVSLPVRPYDTLFCNDSPVVFLSWNR